MMEAGGEESRRWGGEWGSREVVCIEMSEIRPSAGGLGTRVWWARGWRVRGGGGVGGMGGGRLAQ